MLLRPWMRLTDHQHKFVVAHGLGRECRIVNRAFNDAEIDFAIAHPIGHLFGISDAEAEVDAGEALAIVRHDGR